MQINETAKTNFSGLSTNPYPGRGIVIGTSPDEKSIYQIYWIMGRSANSRNRIFLKEDNNFLKTKAFDESKVEDPSLIIYYPLKHIGNAHIVTNGDQTDTIHESIKKGGSFEDALHTRDFEPDGPNFTPRISGITDLDDKKYVYRLAINKTIGNNEKCPLRQFFCYAAPLAGFGHMITTYSGDGNPLPSFQGEPLIVPIFDSIGENLNNYWGALNGDNRISLLVKKIDRQQGTVEIVVENKLV